MKIWPRTLAVQMIAVTAAAVVISNFAVAWWFELGNERQKETALNERVTTTGSEVAMRSKRTQTAFSGDAVRTRR